MHTARLKELLFCMEYNPFCFKCLRAGILKLWSPADDATTAKWNLF